MSDYLRRALTRRDWLEAGRAGLLPFSEVTAACAVALQDFAREAAGRSRNGLSCATTPQPDAPGPVVIGPACPVQRCPYVEPSDEVPEPPANPWIPPCSYDGDHGQKNRRNGAIVADDDLSWYYGASALELGLSSSFDAMVTQLLIGGVKGNRTDAGGPSPRMLAAASRQIRIRRILRKLSPKMQAVLEAAYTDRRYTVEELARTEPGAGAVLWHAKQYQRDFMEGPIGTSLEAMQRLVMALSGTGRRRVPPWSALEGELHAAVGSFKERVLLAAAGLVRRAQLAYERAADDDRNGRGPEPSRRRRRGAPGLVAVAATGSGKRKLVEAPRRRAA